jgi:thioredoxin reductase (NADPH)
MANPNIDRREQTFPILTQAQIERIALVGQKQDVRAGQVLFQPGDQNSSFYVVLAGAVEVVRPFEGHEDLLVTHGRGSFTGEINMLSARRSLVRGRVVADGSLLVVDREHFRGLVHRDSELSEIFMRAFILRRVALIAQGRNDLVLVGSRHSAQTLRLKEFLTRNGHPYTYQDVETEPGVEAMLERFHVATSDMPVIVCQQGQLFRNPTVEALAAELGLSPDLRAGSVRDVVIIGAGPAGLAAAVYAASEGLDVLVIESNAPGGQAGTSSKIENYLGFPTGISGQALSGRARSQAEKFGADVAIGRTVVRIDCDSMPYQVFLANGEVVRCRTIVVASGAQYRKPDLPELSRFEGAGVLYSATHLEAQLCEGEEIAIVGGGNSAGQAAVFLSLGASKVSMLVRGPGLADSMSRYLIQRIEDSRNVTLRTRTQVAALEGDEQLERVLWRHVVTGESETRPIRHVFMMTGAVPNTGWLKGCVVMDDKGFVKTGLDLQPDELDGRWRLARRPHLFETSIPGVFAVGDVRAESIKRVASAVGEGSICVQLIHRSLQEL